MSGTTFYDFLNSHRDQFYRGYYTKEELPEILEEEKEAPPSSERAAKAEAKDYANECLKLLEGENREKLVTHAVPLRLPNSNVESLVKHAESLIEELLNQNLVMSSDTIPTDDFNENIKEHIKTLLKYSINQNKLFSDPISVTAAALDVSAKLAFDDIIKEIRMLKVGLNINKVHNGTAPGSDGHRGGSPESLKRYTGGAGDRTQIKKLTKLCMFLILSWFIYDESKMQLMIEGYYMIRNGYCFTFKEAFWAAIGLDNQICTQYRVFVMSIFNLTIFDYFRHCLTTSGVATLFYQLNNLMDYVLDTGLDIIRYDENDDFNTNQVLLLLPDTPSDDAANSGGFQKISRKVSRQISKTKKKRIRKHKTGHKTRHKKTKHKKKKRRSRLIS